ncbi:MAG: DUF2939 domain-containing protein [Methylococcaceae bacterium]|nr:DUF2939 domain-containing protein [Methylococcaceae bacterium]
MKNTVLGGLVLLLFAMVGGFLYSPYVTLGKIDLAIKENDITALNDYVDIKQHRALATKMIEGKLKIKKDIDRQEDRYQAWKDYGDAFRHVDQAVDSLLSPAGYQQMLKGNLDYIKAKKTTASYQPVFNDANVFFDSLTEAHTFVKQDSGLMTKVILKRSEVFTWKISHLEYPIKEMLDAFVKSLTG